MIRATGHDTRATWIVVRGTYDFCCSLRSVVCGETERIVPNSAGMEISAADETIVPGETATGAALAGEFHVTLVAVNTNAIPILINFKCSFFEIGVVQIALL